MNLSNSPVKKLKSTTKNATNVTLRLSLNFVGDDETNFLYKLLLTDRQVASLRKVFANKSLANIKFSKTQLPKIIAR